MKESTTALAHSSAGSGDKRVVKLEVGITKGPEGLGLDLIPINIEEGGATAVQVAIVTPYSSDPSIPHPAVAASPPLLNKVRKID